MRRWILKGANYDEKDDTAVRNGVEKKIRTTIPRRMENAENEEIANGHIV